MVPKTASRDTIISFLNRELRIAAIDDVSCNGLQVQGSDRVSRIGLAVDASLEAYQAAAAAGCQMVIAHHGMIWKGLTSITGPAYTQVKFLLDRAINLYAAHLPLDLHATLGNNAELARLLKLKSVKPFGDYHGTMLGFEGVVAKATTAAALAETLDRALGGHSVILPFGKKLVRRIAVVSGSAGELMREAIEKEIDCYVTGEPKHDHHHLVKEGGINVVYCGHYHSEKLGVRAVGRLLEKKFGVECRFLDIETIV